MSDILIPGNTAVIMGCSSGIGRAAAVAFAQRGMNVWMVDDDEEQLSKAKALVESKCQDASAQTISARVLDVSDETHMNNLAAEVFAANGTCDFLFNNASTKVSVPEGDAMCSISAMKETLDTNLYGVINGCLAFVPHMKQSGSPGIVVNTGSKQGLTMPPGNLPYNVSKAALKSYTEGLEYDLFNTPGSKVRSAFLVPGWVNTAILKEELRQKNVQTWMPDQVIEYMIQELDGNKFYILCPDNDVDLETDKKRMTWGVEDITMDRPPFSRLHPEYKDKFEEYLQN